jgi:hypothetical protein
MSCTMLFQLQRHLPRGKARLVAIAGVVGFVLGATVNVGCILPDYCIKIQTSGKNNCVYLEEAVMWPAGQPEKIEPVPSSHMAPGPTGCICLNSTEQNIIDFEVPLAEYDVLLDEIEKAARQACHSLVPAGWDHNCFVNSGPGAPTPIGSFVRGLGNCVGNCIYANPPPGGTCPDPNPYECAEGGAETGGEDHTDDTDDTDDGSDDPGLGAGDYIDCEGRTCDIDRKFAEMLYSYPELLADEGTTLVYDPTSSRFLFQGITMESLPGAMGLENGDQLESINNVTVDGLQSAFATIADNANTHSLRVRVKRGTQWIDFTYNFVP